MYVIGTAGHVDHGKSTLVKALTGTHPDRLKEEKEREMTIDLGFAWMKLVDGRDIGIVDVPGHRDFIENMLSGVGGIDLALLVIAADESVMPQTREHLAILDLLAIHSCIIVMTKCDMVDDPEWLDMVELEIHEVLQGTAYSKASVIRVSASTGFGILELMKQISVVLKNTQPRVDLGRPRLPIDRVFSIAGFGTVVTGTLLDGSFHLGDEVEILPEKNKARIRGLQTHKQKSDAAFPGSRTAVNLSGIDQEEIQRGSVLVLPGKYNTTQRFDCFVRILRDSSLPLKHNMEVKLFLGAAEEIARVRLLGQEQIAPGDEGWVQVELRNPVVAVRNDRFILRLPSPGITLGGGIIVNPQPSRRHKRFQSHIISQMESYLHGLPEDIFVQSVNELNCCEFSEAVKKSRLELTQIQTFYSKILEERLVVQLDSGDPFQKSNIILGSRGWFQGVQNLAQLLIQNYHQQFHLREGIPRSELRSKLKVDQKIFNLLLTQWSTEKIFLVTDQILADPQFEVEFSSKEQNKINEILALFQRSLFQPPSVKECVEILGDELFTALLNQTTFVKVSADIVFLQSSYTQFVEKTQQMLNENGSISVAQFRDCFSTTRKYALAFLEHLDQLGFTKRDGDVRVAGNTKIDVKLGVDRDN